MRRFESGIIGFWLAQSLEWIENGKRWLISICQSVFNLEIAARFPEHLFTRTRTFYAYAYVCIQILFMTLLKRLLLFSCRFIYHKINDNPFVSDQK